MQLQYKAIFGEKKKVINAEKQKVSNLTTLREVLKSRFTNPSASFNNLPADFTIFYLDEEGDRLQIESQEDYQMMIKPPRKIKIYLCNNGELPPQNMNDTSNLMVNNECGQILSKSLTNNDISGEEREIQNPQKMPVSAVKKKKPLLQVPSPLITTTQVHSASKKEITPDIPSTKPAPPAEGQNTPNKKIQQLQAKVQLKTVQKAENVNVTKPPKKTGDAAKPAKKTENPVKPVVQGESAIKPEKKKEGAAKPAKKIEDPSKPAKKVEDDKSAKAGQVPQGVQPAPRRRQNNFVHQVRCNGCKNESIKGWRWKCLSCFDFDVCEDCYQSGNNVKNHKDKTHKFVEIENDSFWQKVNLAHSIRKLFNPNYRLDENDLLLGEWISEDDILKSDPKFVNEVWLGSADIARRVTAQFDNFQRGFKG